ncbi:hypothetical protein GRF29_1g3167710 [Pseudopithomyces chartarum]|uniref:RING-type domain-containing protein n=1 Tax=Pseudopithomyces chartarum TaxID=1892770 RepID=A0AAN6M917_9PLEO|nr:hypothetical protein GRF29_1g3167710 [Pseudopithomyces chartarum]
MPAATTNPPERASIPTFVLFTTPIQLCCLEPDSRHCPICSEPYIEPQNTRPTGEDGKEWAMRVDMSATEDASTKCCRHVFGRRCLEKHINSKGPWHNKCPLCRQKWWINDAPLHHSSINEALGRRTRSGSFWRRSERGSGRQSESAREGFIGQILDTFAVAEGSERIDATVQEVEETLERLYQSRGQRSRGSDVVAAGPTVTSD